MHLPQQGHRPVLPAYLEKWATDYPGRIAMVEAETGRQWLYGQLAGRMYLWIRFLQAKRVQAGDKVLVAMPPGANSMALIWACWRIGAVPAVVPTNLPVNSLIRMWGLIEPVWGFVSEEVAFLMEQAGIQLKREKTRSFLVDAYPRTTRLKQVPKALSSLDPSHVKQTDYRKWRALLKDLAELHAWHPALILPAHERLYTPFLLCYEHIEVQMAFLASRCRNDQRIKTLVQPSLTQWQDWLMSWMLPIAMGGSVIIGPAVARRQQLNSLIETYQVNTLVSQELDPALMHGTPRPRKRSLDSVQQVFIPVNRVHAHDRKVLQSSITLGLNAPETGGFYALQVAGAQDRQAYFLPVDQISIREPMQADGKAGREVREHETIGEICVHPPLVFSGYLDPSLSETQKITQEGIFYTGKMGQWHTEGTQQLLRLLTSSEVKTQIHPSLQSA